MKFALLTLVLVISCLTCGCSPQVAPDQKENKAAAYIKPGQKVNDVQVNINK